jgi:hypothetical protein
MEIHKARRTRAQLNSNKADSSFIHWNVQIHYPCPGGCWNARLHVTSINEIRISGGGCLGRLHIVIASWRWLRILDTLCQGRVLRIRRHPSIADLHHDRIIGHGNGLTCTNVEVFEDVERELSRDLPQGIDFGIAFFLFLSC